MNNENTKDKDKIEKGKTETEKEVVIAPTDEKDKKIPSDTKADSEKANSDGADGDDLDDQDLTEIKLEKAPASNTSTSTPVRKPKKRLPRKVKKLIKALIIIAAIIIGIVIFAQYSAYKVFYESDLFSSTTEEAVVERKDLMSTISTTGTIQSKDVRTITSALTGVTIDEVNCEVGDIVQEGQVVVAFSREDINEKISQIEQDISKNKASQALTEEYKAKEHNFDYGSAAYDNYTAAANTVAANTTLARAQEDLAQACSDKSDYVRKYNEAVENKNATLAKLEEAQALFALFNSTNTVPSTVYPTTNTEFPNNEADLGGMIRFMDYQFTVDEFEDYISDLQSKVTEYETTIKNYDTNILNYNTKITNAERSVQDAQTKLGTTQASQNETIRKTTNNLVTSDYNYAKDSLTAGDNVTSLERQLDEQIDKLDKYIVTAPITGLVTAVDAQEGNGYQATTGALMTIQAVDSFEVTTQIDEYDINRVVVGQKVAIMTDATGDDTLDGEVSFISPTATAGTNGSSNTYEVKINVLSDDSRLKLGMSAKLNIITDSHDNVLAVRYDAIEEKDNGELVVYVIDDKNSKIKSDEGNQDSAKGGDKGSDEGILVVSMDGTAKVSGTPTPAADSRDENKDSNKSEKKPGKKDEKPSFIQFLFSNKDDLDVVSSLDKKKDAKEVVITKGIEGDYYTEIQSPEIKEGTVLMVSSKKGNLQNAFMMMMNGDMGGGDNMGGGPGGR